MPAPLIQLALWLQRPSNGSPFTDASLPFDELKAPPDSAFDILIASLAMILLSAIAAGVFLGLSKLGALEDQLKRLVAQNAERDGALRQGGELALAPASRDADSGDTGSNDARSNGGGGAERGPTS